MERVLPMQEAARRLGVSIQTLRRLVRSGALQGPVQVSPGRHGMVESELTEYIRAAPREPLVARTSAANAADARAKAAKTRAANASRDSAA